MKLGKMLFIAAFFVAVGLPRVGPALEAPAPAERFGLSVLYVGHPGSSREGDFVKFLKQHFKEVKTAELGKFREDQFAECDVVILDYDGDGFKSPKQELSPEYSRPTITVGVTGALLVRGMSLKPGYL